MASLEEKIDGLTKAVNRNSDLLEKAIAAGVTTGASAGATGGKAGAKTTSAKKTEAAKSRYTAAQVQTAVGEVKEKVDAATAKAIIAKFAGEDAKLAQLVQMPEKFDDVMEACAEALAGVEEEAAEDDDDI